MPIADGYAALDFLQRENPAMLSRVIVVTASLSPREMDRVDAYPIRGVIAKPFEVYVLQAAVKHCAGVGGDPFLRGPGQILSSGVLLLLAEVLHRVQ